MSSNPVVKWADVRKLAITLKRKVIKVAKWCKNKKSIVKKVGNLMEKHFNTQASVSQTG
jgi:hypothetical protein